MANSDTGGTGTAAGGNLGTPEIASKISVQEQERLIEIQVRQRLEALHFLTLFMAGIEDEPEDSVLLTDDALGQLSDDLGIDNAEDRAAFISTIRSLRENGSSYTQTTTVSSSRATGAKTGGSRIEDPEKKNRQAFDLPAGIIIPPLADIAPSAAESRPTEKSGYTSVTSSVPEIDPNRKSVTDAADRVYSTMNLSRTDLDKARETVAKYARTGNPLLEMIASKESGGNYNVVFGGKNVPLTDMTINEVLKWQKDYVRGGSPSSAAGKYQIISKTLEGLKGSMGLSGNEVFDEKMQDRMAMKLLEGRGYNKYLAGTMDEKTFQQNIAKEWASMPALNGKSYYDGDGLNKAGAGSATVILAMRTARDQFNGGGVEQPASPGNATPAFASTIQSGGVNQTTKPPADVVVASTTPTVSGAKPA